MRRPTALLAVALTALVLAGVGAAPAVSAPATGGRYVALGDSYATGLGLTPPDTSPNAAACTRSAGDYPHQVATALGLDLVDVTCGGASTGDFTGVQKTNSATVPPQFDALTADTRLVTLTIGGNDLGFGEIVSSCASTTGPDGPVLGSDDPNCKAKFDADGHDQLGTRLTDVVRPALDQALAAIREKSPSAAIVVVDYPALVPDAAHVPSGGCWTNPLTQRDSLPFTSADLPYLQGTEARLNQALADAAGKVDAGVASTYTASLAHTPCSSAPWVNGVRVSGLSLDAASLHPNATGAQQMAEAAVPVARTLLAGGDAPTPAAVAGTADPSGGVPSWVWVVVAAGVLLLALLLLGVVRVARRR